MARATRKNNVTEADFKRNVKNALLALEENWISELGERFYFQFDESGALLAFRYKYGEKKFYYSIDEGQDLLLSTAPFHITSRALYVIKEELTSLSEKVDTLMEIISKGADDFYNTRKPNTTKKAQT